MPNWKRITLVVFVLIGGTMAFGYWSFNQFDTVFDGLETTLSANIPLVSSSLEKDTGLASTSLVSLSPEEDAGLASASLEISKDLAIPTDLELSELSFNFPRKGDEIYVGCTYPISWQPSTIITSLEADLIDAGAKKSVGPIESSLVKEIDPQNLSWKVGFIWPGEYYIKALKINDTDVEIRSEVFTINNMPKGINTAEREKICKKSIGG